MSGQLILVSTPIGNLGDLSDRARDAFRAADLVLCEDTRHTGRLLAQLEIKRPLLSLHEHNERARTEQVLAALRAGDRVALTSDAGTPLVSDPGFFLVRQAIAEDLQVTAVPGPSAVVTALTLSGLPPLPFTFLGFPPPKGGKRRTFYRHARELAHTVVVYESPHRIVASLQSAIDELGDRPAALCREMTKLHEEILRGPLSEIQSALEERDRIRGEIVLVIDLRAARDP